MYCNNALFNAFCISTLDRVKGVLILFLWDNCNICFYSPELTKPPKSLVQVFIHVSHSAFSRRGASWNEHASVWTGAKILRSFVSRLSKFRLDKWLMAFIAQSGTSTFCSSITSSTFPFLQSIDSGWTQYLRSTVHVFSSFYVFL